MNLSYGQYSCAYTCQNINNPVSHCDSSNIAQFSTSFVDSCSVQLCPSVIAANHVWSVNSTSPPFSWSSTDICPQIVFPFDATFIVIHTATDSFNTNICESTINVVSCSSLCDSVSHTSVGCTFNFSAPVADYYLWDFGDGSTSTDQNPVHVYTGSGPYSVWLQIDKGSITENCFFDVLPDCYDMCYSGNNIGVNIW